MGDESRGLLVRAAGEAAELQSRLNDIRARRPPADQGMVAEVVSAVLATMRGDLSGHETGLLAEVEELGQTIAAAKAEIAALHVDDINVSHIPSATDELDAIVAHTATATERILETCETLDQVAETLGRETDSAPAAAAALQLQDATTRIYEACSFQDITGQRITKVVATLKTIEAKISHMIETFGHGSGHGSGPGAGRGAGQATGHGAGGGAGRIAPPAKPVVPAAPLGDEALLNGPQLPAMAMDQSDIDKLLASFD